MQLRTCSGMEVFTNEVLTGTWKANGCRFEPREIRVFMLATHAKGQVMSVWSLTLNKSLLLILQVIEYPGMRYHNVCRIHRLTNSRQQSTCSAVLTSEFQTQESTGTPQPPSCPVGKTVPSPLVQADETAESSQTSW